MPLRLLPEVLKHPEVNINPGWAGLETAECRGLPVGRDTLLDSDFQKDEGQGAPEPGFLGKVTSEELLNE